MKILTLKRFLPDWKNALLAVLSAALLILSFPDWEFSYLAWFALVPLLGAIGRERESPAKSFIVGWLFGTIFFFGTCWWLTFAPITYAGFPPALAYFLMLFVSAAAGFFPALFAAILSILLKRFGTIAILCAPFVWVLTEFLRHWLTGNTWNAIAYSQAFVNNLLATSQTASIGGIYLTGFLVCQFNVLIIVILYSIVPRLSPLDSRFRNENPAKNAVFAILITAIFLVPAMFFPAAQSKHDEQDSAIVVGIQPNVPMAGLNNEKWKHLRQKHVELAEFALRKLPTQNRPRTTVIFPESPMNFAYDEDEEFQRFVHGFAAKHDIHVLFNSAEPDMANNKYFNSAVLVDPQGKEIAQYDKIYLVPFAEFVPAPLEGVVPALVGSFSYGSEYDLMPIGDAKAGIMICFESHFGQLSRQFVQDGADVLIEMTNDGYLGQTPVLRQHLASAVFRAIETNRPLLRVTNVGITAYIDERGQIIDPAANYTEDTRIWSVSKSNGSQTFYVRFGDWFAWLCSVITLASLILSVCSRQIKLNEG